MSDNSHTPEEPDKNQRKPEKEPLLELSDEELETVLSEHEKWVETDGKEGEQARLIRYDLRGKDFRGHNISRVIVIDCDLEGADLNDVNLTEAKFFRTVLRNSKLGTANLQGAILFDSDMTEAFLLGANIQGAVMYGTEGIRTAFLNGCNMEDVTGLRGDEFARADITGAKLPADIAKWQVLDVVTETSKNARKIFLAMLLGCVYSWLTIASTTDVNLLTNSASSPLPIIGTAVPIVGFYFAAPLMLVGLYLYLHFYLQRLWENLAGLPAIFEDGKRIDQRAYPWLLTGLVRRHFEVLKVKRTLLQKSEETMTLILAWAVVPATLISFWFSYMPRHDWIGTGFQVILVVTVSLVGVAIYRHHGNVLKGRTPQRFYWSRALTDRRLPQYFGAAVLGLVLMWYVPYGFQLPLNLERTDVSQRPDDYWQMDQDQRREFVIGARLDGKNLMGVNARQAFLSCSSLRFARLYQATLDSANLSYANLYNADLHSTSLRHTVFVGANLRNANLNFADATGAEFSEADMSETALIATDISGANLSGAVGLTQEQLDDACGDESTVLPWPLTVDTCWPAGVGDSTSISVP